MLEIIEHPRRTRGESVPEIINPRTVLFCCRSSGPMSSTGIHPVARHERHEYILRMEKVFRTGMEPLTNPDMRRKKGFDLLESTGKNNTNYRGIYATATASFFTMGSSAWMTETPATRSSSLAFPQLAGTTHLVPSSISQVRNPALTASIAVYFTQ